MQQRALRMVVSKGMRNEEDSAADLTVGVSETRLWKLRASLPSPSLCWHWCDVSFNGCQELLIAQRLKTRLCQQCAAWAVSWEPVTAVYFSMKQTVQFLSYQDFQYCISIRTVLFDCISRQVLTVSSINAGQDKR